MQLRKRKVEDFPNTKLIKLRVYSVDLPLRLELYQKAYLFKTLGPTLRTYFDLVF